MTKRCGKCGYTKPMEAFSRDRQRKDGRYPRCKACHRENYRAWESADPARARQLARARSRKWRNANPDKQRAATAAWKAANSERVAMTSRIWRETNPERASARFHIWYARDPEAAKASSRERSRRWRAAHPEAVRALRRTRKFTERDCEYIDILSADPCAYCGAVTEHIDHIVPVAVGGDDSWTNLTGACALCNERKTSLPLLRFLLGGLA